MKHITLTEFRKLFGTCCCGGTLYYQSSTFSLRNCAQPTVDKFGKVVFSKECNVRSPARFYHSCKKKYSGSNFRVNFTFDQAERRILITGCTAYIQFRQSFLESNACSFNFTTKLLVFSKYEKKRFSKRYPNVNSPEQLGML